MVRVTRVKTMPDNPIKKGDECPKDAKWYNNVTYEIWDKREKEPYCNVTYVCYASITSKLMDYLNKDRTKARIQNGFTRYYCKNGDNRRRLKFIIYICQFFSPMYKEIKIYWSAKHKQIVVDAYYKLSTPIESVYALGAFMRLSWEQYGLWEYGETRNFELLCQALHSGSTGHIPVKFLGDPYYCDFKNYAEAERVGRISMAILLHLLSENKVYKTPMSKALTQKITYMPHEIQLTAYNAVTASTRFKSHKFKTTRRNDW